MASAPAPTLVKKLGSMYSWLIRQPAPFAEGIRSISDVEKLYDVITNSSTAANASSVAEATLGYDPCAKA